MLVGNTNITFKALMDLIYPVDSYYITESAALDTEAKMNEYFGGSWTKVVNKFLYGADTAGQEGGEATHTLSETEMPSHRHQVWSSNSYNGDVCGFGNQNGRAFGGVQKQGSFKFYDVGITGEQLVENTGGSQPHNNMPPYRMVYMYRRTALNGGGLRLLLTYIFFNSRRNVYVSK